MTSYEVTFRSETNPPCIGNRFTVEPRDVHHRRRGDVYSCVSTT